LGHEPIVPLTLIGASVLQPTEALDERERDVRAAEEQVGSTHEDLLHAVDTAQDANVEDIAIVDGTLTTWLLSRGYGEAR
jgi:hypothetical protein